MLRSYKIHIYITRIAYRAFAVSGNHQTFHYFYKIHLRYYMNFEVSTFWSEMIDA